MARMGVPNRSDTTCMAGDGEPVVNGGPDASSLYRRFAWTMVPSY